MIQIERILCPVDFSLDSEWTDLADQALRYAIALARTHGSKLHVVSCSEGLLDIIERERLTRRYEAAIQAARGIGKYAPADREFFILAGPPAEEIPSFAADRRIDLIVMGSRRRSLSTALLGSTAEAISRTAPCPVLVVHSQEREFVDSTTCELDLNRILVAHDFSNDSELALRYGQLLAQEHQAELHLFHAMPYSMTPALTEKSLDVEDGFQRASRRLRDSVPSEAMLWCKVKNAVRVGPAYREILSYAEEESIDLICLGVHGAGFTMRALFGSNADRVLRQAPCPVLIARPLKPAVKFSPIAKLSGEIK
jgi:nucleotide-binding universal stress UspA family protein